MKYNHLVLWLLLIVILSSCDEKAWYKKNVPSIKYKGVIICKYNDSANRDLPKFLLQDSNVYNFYNEQMFELAQPGDSVIKDPGTLRTILKKKDTTLFFYPAPGGVEVRDSV